MLSDSHQFLACIFFYRLYLESNLENLSIKSNYRFSKRFRIPLLILILGLLIVILWPSLVKVKLQYFDFNVFYNAAYHTLRNINPYNADWFLYPPWVIPFFFPFSLLPFSISRLLWYIICVGLILYLSDRLWNFYQGPDKQKGVAWLFGITFSASIFALIWGQLSPLVLFGLVLFLENYDEKNRNYIWTAVSFYFLAMKPQTLFLLYLAILAWTVDRKKWKLLLASISILVVASITVTLFVPEIFPSYVQSFVKNPPSIFGTPTSGYWLRLIFGDQKYGLQLIPPICGVIWFCFYWVKHKNTWRWANTLPILVFVSLLTTPHSWTHDYLIMLPGILQGVISFSSQDSRKKLFLLILVWLAFNITVVVLHFRLSDFWFYWEVLLIFGFYIAATDPEKKTIPQMKSNLE